FVQVLSRAKGTFAGTGQNDGADRAVAIALLEQAADAVAHIRVPGVQALRAVERYRENPVIVGGKNMVGHRNLQIFPWDIVIVRAVPPCRRDPSNRPAP